MSDQIQVDVCICTHNPRLELFSLVIKAIANQTLHKSTYKVWIIDNASYPPIKDTSLTHLSTSGISYEILREPKLGIVFARTLAIKSSTSEIIIFVDDDNELPANYLENALNIFAAHPEIGMCGGKLLLPKDILYPSWIQPIIPYLGVKDAGEQPMSGTCQNNYDWRIWEPPTAGAVIRKSVTQNFLQVLETIPNHLILGRRGKGLLGSEDSLLAYCAYQSGLECSYQPSLQLIHHISSHRLKFTYLLKLLFAYGQSYVLLRKAMNQPISHGMIGSIPKRMDWWLKNHNSRRHLACMSAWELGFMYELLFYKPRAD